MKHGLYESWKKVLNPELLQENLLFVSMFVVVYEMLEDSVVSKIKDFYFEGIDIGGETTSSRYQTEVKALNRSPVYASLLWLMENGVIDEKDKALFEQVKFLRNKIVHELPKLLMTEGVPPDLDQNFTNAIYLLEKIERWWLVNVEMEVNPEWEDRQVDPNSVTPGSVWMLKLLLEVASGKTEYHDEFKKFCEASR
ncbi:MAG: hypothetical protein WBL07_01140 [Thiothrix litoralis]|uniref:hypothetical protein n=1 Tax=Thiothrix litoralis TaxID=2891210 RepID=UPI003C786FB5